MPAPFKMKYAAVIAASLRRRKLGRFGSFSLLVAGLLVPAALTMSAWHFIASSSANGGAAHSPPIRSALLNSGLHASALRASALHPSSWAGGLELTQQSEEPSAATRQPENPITSASYTSGFDKKVAGLNPLPPPARSAAGLAQAQDPRTCPRDLNCSFRPMRAVAVSATPLHQPAAPADPEIVKAKKPETSGFSLFAAHLQLPSPHLPSANILLKPFSFVGTTFVHFVKKM